MPTALQILNTIASVRDGDPQGTWRYVVSSCVGEEWSARAQGGLWQGAFCPLLGRIGIRWRPKWEEVLLWEQVRVSIGYVGDGRVLMQVDRWASRDLIIEEPKYQVKQTVVIQVGYPWGAFLDLSQSHWLLLLEAAALSSTSPSLLSQLFWRH